MSAKNKRIIAIDFDGVIVEEAFPEIGKLMDGAKETIKDLYEYGHTLILWTTRTNEYLDANENPGMYYDKAIDFLRKNDMLKYFYSLNDNISTKYNCRKVYAHIYIDDRNLNGFPGWHEVRKQLI